MNTTTKWLVYRNIYAKYELEVPRSKWKTPPKVIENDQVRILWNFQMVMANQPDIVVVDKQQKKAVVIDVAILSDTDIRKKAEEKLEKYQSLKEEILKVKAPVVPVVVGALSAVTPRLWEWLLQNLVTTGFW